MIFTLKELSDYSEPNWKVATTHPVSDWASYQDVNQTFAEGEIHYPNVYVFPTRTDYLRVFHYAKENNVLPEWITPPIPMRISQRQLRLALLGLGVLDSIHTMLDSFQEPLRSQVLIEWEFASYIDRFHPLFLSVLPSLNMTEQDLDNLFISASSL